MIQTYGNPQRRDIDDWVVLSDGKLVHRFGVLTTSVVHYRVYEPSALWQHSTIRSYGTGVIGDMTTRPLPPEIAALPEGSPERCLAVDAYRKALDAEADALIRQAFAGDFAHEEVVNGQREL